MQDNEKLGGYREMDTVRIFSEFVAAKIKDYLPIKYQEADCRVKESIGNNGIYQSK